MASTALPALVLEQGILNFDDSSLNFASNTGFLDTNSILSLVETVSPSFAALITRTTANLNESSGQVLIAGGVLEASVVFADGTTWEDRVDLPTTLRDWANLAALSNGSFTLADGILGATITTGDQTATLASFDLASFLGTLVFDTLTAIDATATFTNGAFGFVEDSIFGPISGTLDVGGGDLNIDLITPFGDFSADIDFGEGAVLPFTVPVPILGSLNGVVDFNTGYILAPLGFLGDLAVPIASLNGNLSLVDGVASLQTSVPIATGLPFVGNISIPVDIEIEVGPLASQYIVDFVTDLVATGTLTNGVLTAAVDSPLGLFETTFDVVAFTNQGADFFAGVDGLIELDNGLLTANLTTPIGDVNGSLNLSEIANSIEAPMGLLG